MYAYLSKKIAIPNGVKLRCAAWNAADGWIAAGGEGGLLKLLKLGGGPGSAPGEAAAASLTANQSLAGHDGAVTVAAWNDSFQKLTTGDESGLIIVWALQKGEWVEEMVNNRNRSYVTDMRWSATGEHICIVYADGAVIVGSADGVRLWGKELNMPLTHVQWSPDGRLILFGTEEGEVHLYDSSGNAAAKLQLQCNEGLPGAPKLAAIEWYDGLEGYLEPDCPTLAICCENGRVQLMRGEADPSPVCIDTGLKLRRARWSRNGALLALAGSQSHFANGETREVWQVQFYDPLGNHLASLRVPGGGIRDFDWEAGGLRLVLAVDQFIYFASVKPNYRWAYFSNTLVFGSQRADRPEARVTFWDTVSGDKYVKYMRRLAGMAAGGDHCVLAARGESADEHVLILCNAIGSPVDSRHIAIEPRHLAISDQHVVAASSEVVYVWQYRAGYSRALATEAAGRKKEGRDRIFHIDEGQPGPNQTPDTWQHTQRPTADPITAITASATALLVGRASGTVCRYSLPHLGLEATHTLRCGPQRLALNCSGSRMAVLDGGNVLSMYDFGPAGAAGGQAAVLGQHLEGWERRDVWDVRWAEDDPELLVCCEKSKMVVIRALEPEEPVPVLGHVLALADLEVRCAQLDALVAAPDTLGPQQLSCHETRGLREARTLIETSGAAEAVTFISSHSPHPRLWRILAQHCLRQMDLATAEKAFVHCHDYPGIQFVKQLARLDEPGKQRAEVAAWLRDFEGAEAQYAQMDRPDLAVDLQVRLGDWFKVEQMLHDSNGGDDELIKAWTHIGEHYADRHKWGKAAQYFTQARHSERLAECLYHLQDFPSLAQLMALMPDDSPMLPRLGEQFQSVGLCTEAVEAFTRAGQPKRAVDCCVLLNQWDQAVALAQQHDFPQVEGLMARYAAVLLDKQQHLEAVQLYRSAGRHAEAAKLLVDLVKQSPAALSSPLQAKKLHVLAALEVDSFRRRALDVGNPDGSSKTAAATLLGTKGGAATRGRPGATGTGAHTTAAQTLAGLMTLDAAAAAAGEGGSPVDGAAWHGAEAHHFWLLAHRQLYGGDPEAALRTCLALRRYEDVLGAAPIYSLLALAAFYAGFYEQCSKAFVKLESLPSLPAEQHEALAGLAAAIFMQHPPVDPRSIRETRDKRAGGGGSTGGGIDAVLEGLGSDQDLVCVATGRIIRDLPAVRCKVCRHSMVAAEVRARAACPLCHSDLYSSAGPAATSSASLRRSSTTGSGSGRSTAAKLGHSTSGGSSRGVQY